MPKYTLIVCIVYPSDKQYTQGVCTKSLIGANYLGPVFGGTSPTNQGVIGLLIELTLHGKSSPELTMVGLVQASI